MKDAIFQAGQDFKFVYNNITVETDGPSNYEVFINYGDEDNVYCKVPTMYKLLLFLEELTGKRPMFTVGYDYDIERSKKRTVTNIPSAVREEIDFI